MRQMKEGKEHLLSTMCKALMYFLFITQTKRFSSIQPSTEGIVVSLFYTFCQQLVVLMFQNNLHTKYFSRLALSSKYFEF